MRSDPIADFLTRVRNASRAEHEKVDIPSSRIKLRLAEILKSEGFIKNFRVLEDEKQGTLRVYLKYGTVPAGTAGLRRSRRDPDHPRRHGRDDRVHVQGCRDRPRGAQAEGGRRSPRLRVVRG